jgi:L-rhamnose mutarotase
VRKAFVMQLLAGNEDRYFERHNPIWPELERVLKAHGVSNYSIFLERKTGKLFAYAEIENEERWNAIAETGVCRRWWTSMKDLMETNEDESPKATPLEEMFHIQTEGNQ